MCSSLDNRYRQVVAINDFLLRKPPFSFRFGRLEKSEHTHHEVFKVDVSFVKETSIDSND